MTSRQLKAEETKQQIMGCYLDLMREMPAEKIKISEVCSRANVSVGIYYYYYKSKDSIIRDIYYHIDDRFRAYYQELTAPTNVGRIVEYITHTGDEARDYYGLQAATNIYRLQMEIDGSFFLDTDRPFSQNLFHLLQQAIEAGELPNGLDIQSTVVDLLCIFRGIVYSWCLLKGTFDIKDTIYTTVTAYMQQLGAQPENL